MPGTFIGVVGRLVQGQFLAPFSEPHGSFEGQAGP
jgi:hypothetical protein